MVPLIKRKINDGRKQISYRAELLEFASVSDLGALRYRGYPRAAAHFSAGDAYKQSERRVSHFSIE